MKDPKGRVAAHATAPTQAPPRRAGSVRFAPYYKVQWHDPRSQAWRDVQQRYADPAAAIAAMVLPRRWRLMRVSPAGRAPYGMEFDLT